MGLGKNRNKLCPCRSGNKVKNCHPDGLSDNEKKQLLNSFRDPTSINFLEFYNSNADKVENFRRQKFDQYLSKLIGLLGDQSSQGESASRAVINALENIIPENLKEKLGKKKIYFWLSLDRRIMPIDGITRHFKSPTSVKLAKFYMNNILYRFSSFSLDNKLAQDNQYTSEDYFTIYEVEILSVILQKIGLLRRISSKGGKILIENGQFGAVSEPELTDRLQRFDEEREKKSGWQHLMGLRTTAIHPAKDGGILDDSKLLFMQINGGETKDFEYGRGVRVVLPHCTPNIVNMTEVYSLSSALDPYFKNKVGVDFLTWLKCISLVTRSFLFGEEANVYQKLFKTAYSLVSLEALYESVTKHPELTSSDIATVLRHATRVPASVSNLDLLELKNSFFVHKVRDDGLLVDGYLAFQYFQRTILDSYKHTASAGDRERGLLFERQVVRAASIAGYKPDFPPGFEFRQNGRASAEIDLALRKDSLLALLDCKSLLTDIDASEGAYDKLNKRINKLRGLLEERDRKAQLLAQNSKGDNYSLEIDKCFSQIISADVEWLPVDDDFFWWTAGVPRISTLDTFLTKVFPYLNENQEISKIYKVN